MARGRAREKDRMRELMRCKWPSRVAPNSVPKPLLSISTPNPREPKGSYKDWFQPSETNESD